jgi:hypothetical protein
VKTVKERDHLETPDVEGEGNIKIHIKDIGYDGVVWLNFI